MQVLSSKQTTFGFCCWGGGGELRAAGHVVGSQRQIQWECMFKYFKSFFEENIH